MDNNSVVWELSALPCSNTNLVEVLTVLQNLSFLVAGPVNVASARSLRSCMKALLFMS